MVNVYTLIFAFGIISSKIASHFNYGIYVLISVVVLISIISYFRDRRGEHQQVRQMVRRALSSADKGLVAAEASICDNQQIVNNSFSYMSDIVLPMVPFLGTFSRVGCALSKCMGYKPSAAKHTAAVIHAMEAGVKELEHLFEADKTGAKGLQCILEGGRSSTRNENDERKRTTSRDSDGASNENDEHKHATFRDNTTTLDSIQSTTCDQHTTPLHEHNDTPELRRRVSSPVDNSCDADLTPTFRKHEDITDK
jgi:hypothetical protein